MGMEAVAEFDQPPYVTMGKRFEKIGGDTSTSPRDKAIKMEGLVVDAARYEFRDKTQASPKEYPEAQRLLFNSLVAHFGLVSGTDVMKEYTRVAQQAAKQPERSTLTSDQLRLEFNWPGGEIMQSKVSKEEKIAGINALIMRLVGELHRANGGFEPEPVDDGKSIDEWLAEKNRPRTPQEMQREICNSMKITLLRHFVLTATDVELENLRYQSHLAGGVESVVLGDPMFPASEKKMFEAITNEDTAADYIRALIKSTLDSRENQFTSEELLRAMPGKATKFIGDRGSPLDEPKVQLIEKAVAKLCADIDKGEFVFLENTVSELGTMINRQDIAYPASANRFARAAILNQMKSTGYTFEKQRDTLRSNLDSDFFRKEYVKNPAALKVVLDELDKMKE